MRAIEWRNREEVEDKKGNIDQDHKSSKLVNNW